MEAKFRPGDSVRVRVDSSPRHMRTPTYIQGKVGTVKVVHGVFCDPESLAYAGDGLPKQFLYLVCFNQAHVWQVGDELSRDKLYIDIYQHWLESA